MSAGDQSVHLVFLGRLTDTAGGAARHIAPGLLSEVLARLEPDLAVALLDPKVRVALNGRLLAGDDLATLTLVAGDELAFLPPVSGG